MNKIIVDGPRSYSLIAKKFDISIEEARRKYKIKSFRKSD